MQKQFQILLAFAPLIFAPFSHANDVTNYVVNGNFETGDFTGWTTDQQTADGLWFIYSGGILPLSNLTFPHPQGGAYAAAADEEDPSSMILYQDIALPPAEQLILEYTYYYHNYNIEFLSPDTLNLTGPNQQARIDIMNPAATDPYSVTPSDILRNLLITKPGAPAVVEPTTVSFNISKFAGRTIRIRFAVADTEYYFNLGIDNVSITVPESPQNQLSAPRNLVNSFNNV